MIKDKWAGARQNREQVYSQKYAVWAQPCRPHIIKQVFRKCTYMKNDFIILGVYDFQCWGADAGGVREQWDTGLC